MPDQNDFLRDPVWQFIGVVIAIASVIISILALPDTSRHLGIFILLLGGIIVLALMFRRSIFPLRLRGFFLNVGQPTSVTLRWLIVVRVLLRREYALAWYRGTASDAAQPAPFRSLITLSLLNTHSSGTAMEGGMFRMLEVSMGHSSIINLLMKLYRLNLAILYELATFNSSLPLELLGSLLL